MSNSLAKQQASRARYLATNGLWQSATTAPPGQFIATQSNTATQSDLDNLKKGLTAVYLVAKRGGRNNSQIEGYIPTSSLMNNVYAQFKSAGYGQSVTLSAFNAQYTAMANAYTNAGHLADNMALVTTALAFVPLAISEYQAAGQTVSATSAATAEPSIPLGSSSLTQSSIDAGLSGNSLTVVDTAVSNATGAASTLATGTSAIENAANIGINAAIGTSGAAVTDTALLSQISQNAPQGIDTVNLANSATPPIPAAPTDILDAAGNTLKSGYDTLQGTAAVAGSVKTLEAAAGLNKPAVPVKTVSSTTATPPAKSSGLGILAILGALLTVIN